MTSIRAGGGVRRCLALEVDLTKAGNDESPMALGVSGLSALGTSAWARL